MSSILTTPTIGTVGQPVRVSTPLAIAANQEARFYISQAPPTSKLTTLESSDIPSGDTTIVRGLLAAAKLHPSADKTVTFTPDVPGPYTLSLRVVTQYRHVPHFGGDVPAPGDLAFVDNELGALPSYAGGDAQATEYTVVFWVAEQCSRTIGVSPDTGTLKIRTYDDTLDQNALDTDRASITPGGSAKSKYASGDPDVLSVLSLIQSVSASVSSVLRFITVVDAMNKWNNHMLTNGTWHTHGAADATNTISATPPTDLAGCITILNAIRTAYEAHRVLTAGSVHGSADTDAGSIVSAPACSDLATAIALWSDLWAKSNHHGGTGTTVHSDVRADGGAHEQLEEPQTEDMLVIRTGQLQTYYIDHIAKVANSAPHAVADSENQIVAVGAPLDDYIASLNTWADSIEKHTANLKHDGTDSAAPYPDGSPGPGHYHTNPLPIKIPLRAGLGDSQGAERLAELCLIAAEQHAFAGGSLLPHASKTWGGTSHATPLKDYYLVRLVKVWNAATRGYRAPLPSPVNAGATTLAVLCGWT